MTPFADESRQRAFFCANEQCSESAHGKADEVNSERSSR